MHLCSRVHHRRFAQDTIVGARHGLGAQQGHRHIIHAHKACRGFVKGGLRFPGQGRRLRFLPCTHSAFLIVQIGPAERIADLHDLGLAQPALAHCGHHIFLLRARVHHRGLAQNAVLPAGGGGTAGQQGIGRIGNAFQPVKGLVEHLAHRVGEGRVGGSLPIAGNAVFLADRRGRLCRLCRLCRKGRRLHRAACQQGKGHGRRHADRNRLFHRKISFFYPYCFRAGCPVLSRHLEHEGARRQIAGSPKFFQKKRPRTGRTRCTGILRLIPAAGSRPASGRRSAANHPVHG